VQQEKTGRLQVCLEEKPHPEGIIFKYMLNKESVFEDVELFIAYPNKDCIRDYWNMAETYAAKVSRRLMYGPITFRKRVFLKTNILNDHLKSNRS
jgi:hypothetical protein